MEKGTFRWNHEGPGNTSHKGKRKNISTEKITVRKEWDVRGFTRRLVCLKH